jgi:hypothetical protein
MQAAAYCSQTWTTQASPYDRKEASSTQASLAIASASHLKLRVATQAERVCMHACSGSSNDDFEPVGAIIRQQLP